MSMSTHKFNPHRQWCRCLSALFVLGGLMIALQLVLPLPVAASSGTATPRATPIKNQPEDIVRAGVSLVRLLVNYTDTAATEGDTTYQCTGLGVIVSSGLSSQEQPHNTWILTDGDLLDNNAAACAQKRSGVKLDSVQVMFSTLYNNQQLSTTLEANAITLVCEKQPCAQGLALLSFNYKSLLPYLTLDTTATTPSQTLELVQNETATALPQASNIARHDAILPYMQQVQGFLTPVHFVSHTTIEPAAPLINSKGRLVGMHLAAATADASTMTMSQFLQDKIFAQPENVVQQHWDTGITNFYEVKNTPAAHTEFQQLAALHTPFTGANDFAAQTEVSVPNLTGKNTATTAQQGPVVIDLPSSTLSVGSFKVPLYPFLAFCLVVLIVLVTITSLMVKRAQRRHRIMTELAEAERKAAIDAQRIAEQEQQQQQAWKQQAAALPADAPAVAAPAMANASARPALHCPRCNEVVAPDANYCTNCRQVLAPSESGLHLRIPRQASVPTAPASAPAAAAPPVAASLVHASAFVDQPTVDMTPDAKNGQVVDGEKTVPFARMQQLKGRRLGFAVGTRSDPGIKRKNKPNEDSLFAAEGMREGPDANPLHFGLFVVADGMGGHANGQDASRRAIQTIIDYMLPLIVHNQDLTDKGLLQLLVDGVQQANRAVHDHNMEMRADMGTTVTATLVVETTAYVANVGDSRTYLYREGEGLRKVTTDHSIVASLVDAGIIKPDDIYTHPKRNQIYRSLGEKPVVEVDGFTITLQQGDRLILCSDGLWDMVRDPRIEEVIKNALADPSKTASALIDAALNGGGEDNVSVIVVSITETAQHQVGHGVHLIDKPDSVQLPQI